MNLADMQAHPKNTRAGQPVICDPCQSEAARREAETHREAAINRVLDRHNKSNLTHRYQLPHDMTKSIPCHRIPHVAADCLWDADRECSCECHQTTRALVLYHRAGNPLPNATGTELGNPNTTPLVADAVEMARRERRDWGFGSKHRSDQCWSHHHTPMQCRESWCACFCHRGESSFAKMVRCEPGVSHITLDTTADAVQVGNKVGYVMWVGMEDGTSPVRMVMMPDGSMIGYDEVA